MKRTKLFAQLLITLLILAGCGGEEEPPTPTPTSAPPPAPSETISTVMHDIYYGDNPNNPAEPPVWTVTNGAQVTLDMDNQGALEHNWAIVKQGETVPVPFMMEEHGDLLLYDAGLLAGGSTGSVTFTAPEAGEYTIICTVAGHYPAMQGKLEVN